MTLHINREQTLHPVTFHVNFHKKAIITDCCNKVQKREDIIFWCQNDVGLYA